MILDQRYTKYDIQCHMLFNVTIYGDISVQILSWVMDEFFHWPNPYLLLPSTCVEHMSWMIESSLKNHLVSDDN